MQPIERAFKKIDWQAIKVISLDLDDTLWDNAGIIERCNTKSFDFLCATHPPIKAHFSLDTMLRISEQFAATSEPQFENMTTLRKAIIRHMLNETHGDLALINPVFAVFYHWRNQIPISHISLNILDKLGAQHKLYAGSNGNANLYHLGIRHYFQKHLIAGIDGRAKPSPQMLNNICQREGILPNQLLHIGDSYEMDIQSGMAAKCQSLQLRVSELEQFQNLIN